jgi:hypothetical protein
MSTIRATITTAAIATMATVDAPRITRPFVSCGLLAKPRRERNSPSTPVKCRLRDHSGTLAQANGPTEWCRAASRTPR